MDAGEERERGATGEFRGDRIAEIRQRAGLSQSALAQALGRSQSWLSNLEQDYRPLSPEDAEKVAAGMGVAVEDVYATVGESIHWLGHPHRAEPTPLQPVEIASLVELLSQLETHERALLIDGFVRQTRVRVADVRQRPGRRSR